VAVFGLAQLRQLDKPKRSTYGQLADRLPLPGTYSGGAEGATWTPRLQLPAAPKVENGRAYFQYTGEPGPIVTEDATYGPLRTYGVTDVIFVLHRGGATEVVVFGRRLTKRGSIDLRYGPEWIDNSAFADQVAVSFWATMDMPGGVRIGRRDEFLIRDGQQIRALHWEAFVDGRYVGRARTRNLALALAEKHLLQGA
jgi:hypothetical protein